MPPAEFGALAPRVVGGREALPVSKLVTAECAIGSLPCNPCWKSAADMPQTILELPASAASSDPLSLSALKFNQVHAAFP